MPAAPLFPDQNPVATPEQRIAAVYTFTKRCEKWALDEVFRRESAGRPTEEWEVYLRFTRHTLTELENGTLDHWFAENS